MQAQFSTLSPRIHYLDALRGVLMVLGVVLHTSLVYSVNGRWYIHDGQTHPFFDAIVSMNRMFRMQAFFIIAGYFSLLIMQRRGVREFISMRFRRILIPFATTAMSLNLLQLWLHDSRLLVAHGQVNPSDMWTHLGRGEWLQHLWFLNVLLIFSGFAIPAALIFRHVNRELHVPLWCIVLTGTAVHLAGATLLHFLPSSLRDPHLFGLINPTMLVLHLPFFLAGMLLYSAPNILRELSTIRFTTSLSIVLTAILWLLPSSDIGWQKGVLEFSRDGISFWLGCHLCFVFFHRFFNQSTAFFRYLSDASYTVFLLHHILVVLLAALLTPIALPAVVKFCIVAAVALGIALAIHEFAVCRSPLLGLLFNGRPMDATSNNCPAKADQSVMQLTSTHVS